MRTISASDIGDQLIVSVAGARRSRLRDNDVLARVLDAALGMAGPHPVAERAARLSIGSLVDHLSLYRTVGGTNQDVGANATRVSEDLSAALRDRDLLLHGLADRRTA